jgi:hypothetical protein
LEEYQRVAPGEEKKLVANRKVLICRRLRIATAPGRARARKLAQTGANWTIVAQAGAYAISCG